MTKKNADPNVSHVYFLLANALKFSDLYSPFRFSLLLPVCSIDIKRDCQKINHGKNRPFLSPRSRQRKYFLICKKGFVTHFFLIDSYHAC